MRLITARRNQGVENSIIPSFGPRLLGDPEHIWNYTTVPQKSLNNREIPYPRGRLLGGSSSISEFYHTQLQTKGS
jgi:choline dehydrogenase-like flavoprotein